MRSTTLLAHIMRVSILAVALLALPQLASAQLPLETKSLKIQETTGTDAVTLTASTVTTPYTLNFPAVNGVAGGILYVKSVSTNTAQLAYTSTTGLQTGWSPVWDTDSIIWVDPAGAANPNWSRTGNNVAAGTYILGTTGAVDANINIVTRNVARMSFAGTTDGKISVTAPMDINASGSDATNIGTGATAGTVTIGRTTGTLTTIGALGHTGTSSFTGNVTLAGAASALIASDGTGASPGAVGHVLTSDGVDKTPIWKSLNDATGIKVKGKVAITQNGTLSQTISGITGMLAGDAVLITLQSTSGVYAVVTATADGSFTVQYTGEATGSLTYLVLDVTP